MPPAACVVLASVEARADQVLTNEATKRKLSRPQEKYVSYGQKDERGIG
jgi:hypothetical protein